MNLLQRAAAADPELLRRFPSERSRHTGMGGALLFTAAIAFASGAVYVSDFMGAPLPLALLCGLVWGAGIFNLDRWMMSSTRRQSTWWKTLGMAVPRIVLSVLIGFVIAEPVLLQIFHQEVSAKAQELKELRHQGDLERIEARFKDIPGLEAQVTALESRLTPAIGSAVESNPRYRTLVAEYDALNGQLTKARAARDRAHGLLRQNRHKVVRTLRTQVHEKRLQVQRLRRQLQSAERTQVTTAIANAATALGLAQGRLAQRQTQRKQAIERAEERYRPGETGLMERVHALGALTSSSGATMLYAWMLRLFIVFVDTVPILFKTLSLIGRKSPAERDEDQREEVLLRASREDAEKQVERERGTQKTRDEIAARENQKLLELADDRIQKELVMMKALQSQAVATQQQVAQAVVDAWAAAAIASIPQLVATYAGAPGPHGNGANGGPVR
jgi:hypothetical protein